MKTWRHAQCVHSLLGTKPQMRTNRVGGKWSLISVELGNLDLAGGSEAIAGVKHDLWASTALAH